MEVDSLEEVGDENREHWKANNLKLIFSLASSKYCSYYSSDLTFKLSLIRSFL